MVSTEEILCLPVPLQIFSCLGESRGISFIQRIDFGEPGFLNRLYFRIGGMEPSRKASVTYLPDRPYMGVFKNPLISRDERKT
jgi:hypothetical protein